MVRKRCGHGFGQIEQIFNRKLGKVSLNMHKHYGPVAQSSVKSAWFKSDLEVYQT